MKLIRDFKSDPANRQAAILNSVEESEDAVLRFGQKVAIQARDYIEVNFSAAVRLEDICRETKVSVRTLQRAFRSIFR